MSEKRKRISDNFSSYKKNIFEIKWKSSQSSLYVKNNLLYKLFKYNCHFNNAHTILSKLNHQNIVNVIDVKDKCLVIPYYGKTDLFELIIEKSKLSYQLSMHIIYQLIQAIKYLHKNKICHLDIKPENIMILPKYKIKLIDFGSAIKLKNKQLIDTIIPFTESYASPNRVKKLSYDPYGEDIWSIGCVFYTMVVGSMYTINADLTEINLPVRNIISKCCQGDSTKRINITDLEKMVKKLLF